MRVVTCRNVPVDKYLFRYWHVWYLVWKDGQP